MHLLDTNVVSELRKVRSGKADRRVADWAGKLDPASLFVSAITILELELGVLRIARRDPAQGSVLKAWFEDRSLLPSWAGAPGRYRRRPSMRETARARCTIGAGCAHRRHGAPSRNDGCDPECHRFRFHWGCGRESLGVSRTGARVRTGSR
jgi:predicted nucleic acid-binding protein